MKDYDRGQVYVATSDRREGHIKIGSTYNDPALRVRQIGRDCRLAYASAVMDGARKVERRAHRVLSLSGEHVHGEWFLASVQQGIEAIRLAERQYAGLELPLHGRLIPGSGAGRPLVDREKSRLVTFRIRHELLDEVDASARVIGNDRGHEISRLLRIAFEAIAAQERRKQ